MTDLKSKILFLYRSKGSFDWYIGWNELKPYIAEYIKKEDEILIVGSGNSRKYFHKIF